MSKIINCNNCQKNFKFKENNLRIEFVADGIQRYYFKCPHCKTKFIVMYHDSEVRQNLNKMDEIKTEIQKLLSKKKDVDKLIEEYEYMYYKNLDISNKYKGIYGR